MKKIIIPLLCLALLLLVFACSNKPQQPGPPPGAPGEAGPAPGQPPVAGTPVPIEGDQAGAMPPQVEGAGVPSEPPPIQTDGVPPPAPEGSSPEPEKTPPPQLPDEQAVSKSECKAFCAVCRRFMDCGFTEFQSYDECREGCLQECRDRRIGLAFRACLAAAADCGAIKKCIEESGHQILAE